VSVGLGRSREGWLALMHRVNCPGSRPLGQSSRQPAVASAASAL